MLVFLSPSKTLEFTGKPSVTGYSLPVLLDESKVLAEQLKKKSVRQLADLMKINPKLAQLNFERFQQWQPPFTKANAQEALFIFRGEVYNGLKAETLTEQDVSYSQNVLRILSGFYGILKPLDLIQPYRLEMGVNWKSSKWKNLYHFWGNKITTVVLNELTAQPDKWIVNLASKEYFDVIDHKQLHCRIITPTFKDYHNGSYRFMTVYGKKARGMMARYIIQNQITQPDELLLFNEDGYSYNDRMSDGDNWVFTRG